MTPLSHGARSYTKIDFHWLSGVNDTAQFWLSGVNNTAEPWLSGVIGDLKLEYLGILTSFFETILGCESEASGEMFHEKTGIQKISWDCPFKRIRIQKLYRIPLRIQTYCENYHVPLFRANFAQKSIILLYKLSHFYQSILLKMNF